MHHEDSDEDFYEELDFYEALKNHTIYELSSFSEHIPDGFSAVCIPLDGTLHSRFSWDEAFDYAKKKQQEGYNILFNLDLGLFDALSFPLDSQAQLAALTLSVKAFCEKIQVLDASSLLGVIVARSSLLFHKTLPLSPTLEASFEEWQQNEWPCDKIPQEHPTLKEELKALFFKHVAFDFLEILIEDLPQFLTPILLLDASLPLEPIAFATLCSLDQASRVKIAIKNAPFPLGCLVYEEGSDSSGFIGKNRTLFKQDTHVPHVGVVLEAALSEQNKEDTLSKLSSHLALNQALHALIQKNTPFKIVLEDFLTTQWAELETLIVSRNVQERARRKLAGFMAAGGTVVDAANSI